MDEFTEFGSKLKQLREAKGISLEDVQSETKIPIDILRSIEREEQIRKLSPIYLKGFLKIYAKFLGVEFPFEKKSAATTHYFKPSEKEDKSKKQPLKLSFSFSERKDYVLWAKIIITLIILLALISFAVKLSHRKKAKAQERKAATKDLVVNAPAATSSPKISQIKLSVRAKENTFLNVKRDGKTVFSQVLRRGSSQSWIAKEKFELSVGNAAALELWFNDKIISPLGKKGQALKNIIITKDGLSTK